MDIDVSGIEFCERQAWDGIYAHMPPNSGASNAVMFIDATVVMQGPEIWAEYKAVVDEYFRRQEAAKDKRGEVLARAFAQS